MSCRGATATLRGWRAHRATETRLAHLAIQSSTPRSASPMPSARTGLPKGRFFRCTRSIVALGTLTMACEGPRRSGGVSALVGVEVVRGADLLTDPYALSVLGDYIAVGDKADSALKLFDKTSGKLVASTGRRGAGPGEFMQIGAVQIRGDNNGPSTVWAFDRAQLRLSQFRIGDHSLEYAGTAMTVGVPGAAVTELWLDDTTLVAAGIFEKGRYFLSDPVGNLSRPFGRIPTIGLEAPAVAAAQALQPSLAVHPGGSLIAIGARYAGRIDIFRVREDSSILAATPLPFEPDIRATRNQAGFPIFVQNGSTRFGYISITATPTRIFAVFSGRTRSDHPGAANYGDQIHVFSWDGTLRQILSVDRDLFAIAVDGGGSRLYALVDEPEPAIVLYKLAARS